VNVLNIYFARMIAYFVRWVY